MLPVGKPQIWNLRFEFLSKGKRRSVMKLQRTFICFAGILFAAGLTASPAVAGDPDPPACDFAIEVNALRAGSPTATIGGTKEVSARARIAKGTAVEGTIVDTNLTIEAFDGATVISSKSTGPIRLGVGKGGKGAKLTMSIPQCNAGFVVFKATFTGVDNDVDECVGTRRVTRSCS
jgi:hypothetical protein